MVVAYLAAYKIYLSGRCEGPVPLGSVDDDYRGSFMMAALIT